MSTLKTEILGFSFQINYEDGERDRLLNLIENFKNRLSNFPEDGKINVMSIIFLSALRCEDQLQEAKQKLYQNKIEENKFSELQIIIERLNKEILSEKNNNSIVGEEIHELDNSVKSIQAKIKNSLK
jgi:cell division protein ZapA (FtsZ GTPase activity inhibitor)